MTRLNVNLSLPSRAAQTAQLPVDGVGLLRSEFMLSVLGRHPAILPEEQVRDHVLTGLRTVAAAFYPRPVVYRVLDAKSNEMRSLLGGADVEPDEENPALGLRGASRILADNRYFLTEAAALFALRREGLDNLQLMIPFVRAAQEARACWDLISPLAKGDNGFQLWLMAEVPAFVDELGGVADFCAGISVGTNDLTQLLHGTDRDNPAVSSCYDDASPTVLRHVRELVETARRHGLQTSVCGDAPSRSDRSFDALVDAGVDAISVSPDAVPALRHRLDIHQGSPPPTATDSNTSNSSRGIPAS